MFTPCVSLDLEMTGVDPTNDAIIEIGLIRFDERGEQERFATLVKPGRSVPKRIEALTGIRSIELEDAPHWEDIAGPVTRFIDGAAIVGQNIGADLAFLRRRGLEPTGPIFDTAELGELSFPGRPDYSLRNLARLLNIDFPVQHRALPDAEAAMRVFLTLRERLARLDRRVLAEVARLTAASGWSLRYLFQELASSARPE